MFMAVAFSASTIRASIKYLFPYFYGRKYYFRVIEVFTSPLLVSCGQRAVTVFVCV